MTGTTALEVKDGPTRGDRRTEFAGSNRYGWLVLAAGVIAYILTVMQRTSLGVAGLDASQRFSISPGQLSAFVFIQVAVYICAQIPAGLLVDRWGARAMLVVSGSLLAAGVFRTWSLGSI